MKLKQSTVEELGVILKEEFGIGLTKDKLKEFAYFLVSFYGIMAKFESSPNPSIDHNKSREEDTDSKQI